MPREMLELAAHELEPLQRLLLYELLANAQWERTVIAIAGESVPLDIGEVLVSQRGLAAQVGMNRDQVRRALRSLERLGIARCRQATPPPAPGPTPRAAPPSAPPPTVVRVEKWREILWPGQQAAPSPAPGPAPRAAPGPAPIQQDLQIKQEELRAPAARGTSGAKATKSSDPRFQPSTNMLFAVFTEIRGEQLNFTSRDGRALREFLQRHGSVSVEKIEERWRRALSLSGYPGCSSVHELLAGRWDALGSASTPGPAARPPRSGGLVPASTREEFEADAQAEAQRRRAP